MWRGLNGETHAKRLWQGPWRGKQLMHGSCHPYQREEVEEKSGLLSSVPVPLSSPDPVSDHFLGAKFWTHGGWTAWDPCLSGETALPASQTLVPSPGDPAAGRSAATGSLAGGPMRGRFRRGPASSTAPARLPGPVVPLTARASPPPAARDRSRAVTGQKRQVIAHVVPSVLRISLAGHVCLPAEELGTGRRPSRRGRVLAAPPPSRPGPQRPLAAPAEPRAGPPGKAQRARGPSPRGPSAVSAALGHLVPASLGESRRLFPPLARHFTRGETGSDSLVSTSLLTRGPGSK